MSNFKPYKVLCIKGYNQNYEQGAWGYLEPLAVYEVTSEINRSGRFAIKNVKLHPKVKELTEAPNDFFIAGTPESAGETVPLFDEYFIRLPD